MLKKVLIFSVISSSALISPIAMADSDDSGFYISAGIGTGLETDIDGSIDGTSFSGTGRTTFSGGIGLGYEFDSNLRIEAGVSRTTADVDSVNVSGINYAVDESGTGNGLGIGKRMPIHTTRALLDAALEGHLDRCSFRKDSNFGFDVPIALQGVDNKFLNPRENWLDKVSYDKEAAKLVKLFSDNFEQYLPFVDKKTKAAAIG